MKWIKTAEQAPDARGDYLVLANGEPYIAFWDGQNFLVAEQGELDDCWDFAVQSLYWLDWEDEKYPKDYKEYTEYLATGEKI
jgi:hypothetical protein